MGLVLEGLLGVSSSTIFKGKGYIQLETEDDIDKVYEPGVYAIKGTSYNDQTLLVFSHNLGQSTVLPVLRHWLSTPHLIPSFP